MPRPRINLVLYYGVLGALAAWRSRIGGSHPVERPRDMVGSDTRAERDTMPASAHPRTNLLWAELMQRSFGFDVLACPRCGGRLRLIALIERAQVIQRILGHLGLATAVPTARPARPPPMLFGAVDHDVGDDSAVP